MFVSGDVGCVCLPCDVYVHGVYICGCEGVYLGILDTLSLFTLFLEAGPPTEPGARLAARKLQ